MRGRALMMKSFILSFILFAFSSALKAELEGYYEKIKGPLVCPSGAIQLKTFKKERILLFGSSHSWSLGEKDKGETKEVVDDGCTYETVYEKKADSFSAKTERSRCSDVSFNGAVTELIKQSEMKLIYQYEFLSANKKKTNYSCEYLKKKE